MRQKIDDTCKKDVDTKRKKRRIGKKNINRKLLYILQCSSMALSWVVLNSRRRNILVAVFCNVIDPLNWSRISRDSLPMPDLIR